MKKSDKVILDLCGGTGSWSQYYKAGGYTVHVITYPKFDVRKWSLIPYPEGNRLVFLNPENNSQILLEIPLENIYGVLAAPPCTMFSRARTTAKTPRDFEGAMSVVRACLEIVWTCRSSGGLKFWALENPMGFLRQFLGNPGYSFRGWEFGDNHVKFTDVWGYFNRPGKKRGAKAPAFNRKKWAAAKKPKEYEALKLSRADVRAITPKGFAKSFFKANL